MIFLNLNLYHTAVIQSTFSPLRRCKTPYIPRWRALYSACRHYGSQPFLPTLIIGWVQITAPPHKMSLPGFTSRYQDIQDLTDLGQTVYLGRPPYDREVWATSQHNAGDWNYWTCIQYWPDLGGRRDIKFQWWWGSWTREPIEDWTERPLRYWEGPSTYSPSVPRPVITDAERTLASQGADAASTN